MSWRWCTLAGIMLVVAAAALTGCLGQRPPALPNATEPTLFVDYQRSGGFAGVNDRVIIFDNGVTLISGRSGSREILLNRSELERIAGVFTDAQFLMLDGNYTSRRGGADFMRYSITFGGKTVNTEDTAVPSSLEPVIAELNRILSTGQNTGQGNLPLPRMGPQQDPGTASKKAGTL